MTLTAARAGATAPAVVAEQLTRRFGSFVAVDDVSFAVARGEVFGFLGPNGAGKTTTLKMLNGLLAPTSGRATVAGLEVGRERRAIKRVTGYMSQLFSLYGDLTVEENIRFFAGLYGVPRARFVEQRDRALAMAGLATGRGRLAGELALGWKQRLALACAMLHDPEILFLDEPTSGVDPISRRRFWDVIHELAAAGTTVFVSTHYMEEAEYCDRLALMNRGCLIALDSPAALREASAEALLELRTVDAVGALAAVSTLPGVVRVGLFGRRLHVTVEDRDAALARLPAQLAERGVATGELRPIQPTLEDVFVALVEAAGGAPVE